MASESGENFVDERHALYVGWVLGIATRNGLRAEPVVDSAGDYTDVLRIHLDDGQHILVAVPYPPDDWSMNAEEA